MRTHPMLRTVVALGALFCSTACGSDTREMLDVAFPAYQVLAGSPGGNSSSTALGNLHVGDERELGEFKFTNTSLGGGPLNFKAIIFYLEGTMRDEDLSHFTVLAPDNTLLGESSVASKGYVRVVFSTPYSIATGQNRTVHLKARVNSAAGRWVRVHVQHDYDTLVVDEEGRTVLPTNFSDQAASDGYFKVVSGFLGLWRAVGSPPFSIPPGTTGVILGCFNMVSAGEDMEVRKIGIKITNKMSGTPLVGEILIRSRDDQNQLRTLLSFSATDPRLYAEGIQVALNEFLTIINNAKYTLEVIGDISFLAIGGMEYTVSVGNLYVHRLSTDDFIDHIPSASLEAVGSPVTVREF